MLGVHAIGQATDCFGAGVGRRNVTDFWVLVDYDKYTWLMRLQIAWAALCGRRIRVHITRTEFL